MEIELKSAQLICRFTLFGATLTHLFVRDDDDRNGQLTDVVLGHDGAAAYQSTGNNYYFGCVVGRVANRIANGRFSLPPSRSGQNEYQLAMNNGPNSLHGGMVGFSRRHWTIVDNNDKSVRFSYDSPHGEDGYPGQLHVEVTYSIRGNTLRIEYLACLVGQESDTTVVNLTQHSYFNLSGGQEPTVLDHIAQFQTKHYLELNDWQIPTGRLVDAPAGSAMDFDTRPKPIGEHIKQLGMGYDHCYAMTSQPSRNDYNNPDCCPIKTAAVITCPSTGIRMTFRTTEPGFQFYTGNYLSADGESKPQSQPDFRYNQWSGFCLEAQRYPDAVNRPDWLNQVLIRRGEEYRQITEYQFDKVHNL